jgi:hypothetical protein
VAAFLPWLADEARAANNAYAVDSADIGETGSCKIESWLSSATNTDFTAVANPSCVVDPLKLKPVELSLLTNRAKGDGEWSNSIAPKAKMNLVPTGVGKLWRRLLCHGRVRCRDRRNSHRGGGDPGDLSAVRDDAH